MMSPEFVAAAKRRVELRHQIRAIVGRNLDGKISEMDEAGLQRVLEGLEGSPVDMKPIGNLARDIALQSMLKRIERLASEMLTRPGVNEEIKIDAGEIRLRAGIALRCLLGDQ